MHALVGADRERPLDPRQRVILAGRQRLLDQRDADGRRRRRGSLRDWPRSRPRWHRRSARISGAAWRTAAIRSGIAVAAELDLEQRPVRRLGGRRRHRLGRARARSCRRWCTGPGSGGPAGSRPALPAPWPRGPSGRNPARCGPRRRHGGLQGLPRSSPAATASCMAWMRGERCLGCLAIARIGHAFAAAGQAVMADLGHDGHGFGLGAAADRETARDRPALDSRGKCRDLLEVILKSGEF